MAYSMQAIKINLKNCFAFCYVVGEKVAVNKPGGIPPANTVLPETACTL